jgi:hypothetical protein
MTHKDALTMISEIENTGYKLTPWENIVIGAIKGYIDRKEPITPAERNRLSRIYTKSQTWAEIQMLRQL